MNFVPQSFIGVNKDFAVKNPKTVRSFLNAMQNAFDYGEKHPDELITSYAKLKTFTQSSWILDKDLIAKGAALMPKFPIKQLDDFYVEDGKKETVYEVLNEYQELLQKEGMTSSTVDLQPLSDNYNTFKSS